MKLVNLTGSVKVVLVRIITITSIQIPEHK
jgi:hypothetical protein